MAKRNVKERRIGMYEAILKIQTLEECCEFFEDVCAMTELRAMEQRFEVAKMLKEDKVYTEIMEKTSASTATISRVNRMLNQGTGCLEKILERLDESKEEE